MSTASDPTFDRLRPRRAEPGSSAGIPVDPVRPADREGKRSLFSDLAAPPATGALALRCQRCGERTVVSWQHAARLAVPGLLVPLPGRGTRAWARCPACRRHGWLQVSLRD